MASQQPVQRQQARSKPTRRSSLATTSTSGQAVNSDYSRPRAAAGGDAGSSSSRSYSTSPRQGLSRSYTTGAVSSMGAGLYSANGNTSPPPQFPVTSSVAPPVQNSASVTFAPAPTRARAYSTSASGLASPTSPAIESMAAINIDAMRRSPPSTTSPAASPPSAPLSSHHALVNATTSSPPSSTAWNSTPTAGHVAGSASSADLVSSGNKIGSQVSPPLVPSNNTSAANRRHSVDPYSMRNTTSIYNHNVTMHQTPVTGHRRHHQSIHVPPSSSEYSCLNEYQHQSNQAHHLMQLGSRYRKASLGSQALLSPSTVDKLSSPPPGSFLSSIQSGSSSRQQPWERGNSYSHGESSSGTQISPTRSRTDPYLSTSPRYSSRASHEAQRNNQLEAKIVLLGRQGVGKTVSRKHSF